MRAVCHYCSRPLPERGHTHYAIVMSRLGDAVPSCVACMKSMGVKAVALRRGDPEEAA